MATTTKPIVAKFPGLARTAPAMIERNDSAQQLLAAQYTLETHLHDLRSEFLAREDKLRQEYLGHVAQIMGVEAGRSAPPVSMSGHLPIY
jgi:hypothetical protein